MNPSLKKVSFLIIHTNVVNGVFIEEPEDIDWMSDRTIIHGNSMIIFWYGRRKGKYVVVRKEVLPLDPESDEPCSDDLSEFDLRI